MKHGDEFDVSRFVEDIARENYLETIFEEWAPTTICGRCRRPLTARERRAQHTKHRILICDECMWALRRRGNEWTPDQVARRRAANLCVSCGSRPPRPGRTACAECATKQTATKLEQRRGRLAQGICTVCGHAPARHGRTMCEACAELYRLRSQRSRQPRRDGV